MSLLLTKLSASSSRAICRVGQRARTWACFMLSRLEPPDRCDAALSSEDVRMSA